MSPPLISVHEFTIDIDSEVDKGTKIAIKLK